MGVHIVVQHSAFKDIGLTWKWKRIEIWFMFGGKGGMNPRIADRIALCIPEENLFNLVEKIIEVYDNNATGKERIGDYIDRIGIETFKNQIDIDSYL